MQQALPAASQQVCLVLLVDWCGSNYGGGIVVISVGHRGTGCKKRLLFQAQLLWRGRSGTSGAVSLRALLFKSSINHWPSGSGASSFFFPFPVARRSPPHTPPLVLRVDLSFSTPAPMSSLYQGAATGIESAYQDLQSHMLATYFSVGSTTL